MTEKNKKPSKHSAGMKWEIEKYLQDVDMPAPHVFLAAIMAGIDPRPEKGRLFELVKRMVDNEDIDNLPHADDWAELKNFIFDEYQKEKIHLKESMDAAKELMQYMYPKRKAVEVSGDLGHLVKVVPLTKEEVDTFEKRFLDEF